MTTNPVVTGTAGAVEADNGTGPTRAQSDALRRRNQGRSKVGSVVFHTAALAVTAVVLYPALWMFMSSLKQSSEIVGEVNLLPEQPSLDNFVTALSGIAGISFWTFFWNSTLLAVGSVIGVLLSSAVAAYAFARIEFPAKKLWFTLMIATLLLPFHVVLIPQYIVFNNLGMIDTFWPLLLGKFLASDAFFVFLMIQFMRGLPRELDEAARVDGAGHLRIFTAIMLPLMKPALVTAAIFTFIWTWNDFMGPLLYLRDPNLFPLPIALRLFVDQTSTSDYGAQMAMAVLAILPVLLFFIAFQRYIVDGVSTQGLKG